jgi:hypothetical protein
MTLLPCLILIGSDSSGDDMAGALQSNSKNRAKNAAAVALSEDSESDAHNHFVEEGALIKAAKFLHPQVNVFMHALPSPPPGI